VTELAFERSFRAWCGRSGVEWRSFRYARPEAEGEVQAHRLLPRDGSVGGVLLVHGAGNDALFSLTGLFAELLARRLEVFTFDVDGHGRHSTTRLSARSATSAVAAALDAWGQAARDLALHAIGISLGGSLLLHSLPALARRLCSATLICAPLRVELSWRSIGRELGRPMLATVWRERARFGMTGLVPSFGPFRRDVYPLRLEEAPGPGAFAYVDVLNSILDSLDLPAAAASTVTPTLLAYGDRDRLVPAAQARRLAELLPASELLLLPRETHLSTPLAPTTREQLARWLGRHQPLNRSTA
jgi:pimeloyl-ACP methyl ester carboxylesterase